jgi:hypothetical protein
MNLKIFEDIPHREWPEDTAKISFTKPIFTRRDPHDSLFGRGLVRYPRFGKSAANQAQCGTPGCPLMCLSICDPWFPTVVFLPQPIVV